MGKYHKRGIIFLTLVLTVALSFSVVAPALGTPLSDFQKEKAELEKQMKEQKEKIKESDSQLETFRAQLATIEAGITQMEKELESADIQLQVANNQLAETTEKLQQTEVKLENRTTAFKERLRETYVNGQVSVLDVFFEATSMDDFLSRFYYLERIVEYDMNTLDEIEAVKAEVEAQKVDQEEKKETLEALKQSKQDALKKLSSQQEEKEKLMAAAENDKATAQKAYDELDAENKAISAEIKKILAEQAKNNSSTPKYNGAYLWPLNGYYTVTSAYGMRFHPVLKVNKMHTGIDISAPKGTTVMACGDGKVIKAGWNNAYGNMVIIDHGGGLTSLYGHMSSLSVSTGTSIKKGDTVGKVGSTGYSTGNHLHLEFQKNGSCVSPWNYVK